MANLAHYSYPSSNLNEYNLDWLIEKVAALEKASIFVLKDTYNPLTKTLELKVVSQADLEA